MSKSFPIIGLLFVAALALAAPTPPTKNIVELAVATPTLSTLVTALTNASLTTALSGTGPFTVFAPTNDAFGKLPKGLLASLLEPANITKLQSILEYHVIKGSAVYSEDLKPLQHVKTLQGQMLQITKDGATVTVQKATVKMANVQATNGVVHIIDGVLMPPSDNIVDLAIATKNLSTLVTALKAGKLVSALSGTGPFTVFAPTNDAFAALPKATLDSLLKPANIKELQAILEYHVIAGSAVYSEDLKPLQHVKTLQGQMLQITKDGATVTVQNAKVTMPNVLATNGVVHIINGVLTPPSDNIVQLANATKNLSTLVTALKAGNLTSALSGTGPFTVFAPNNKAFLKLNKTKLASLLEPKNIKDLQSILEYHVIAGSAKYSEDLNASQYVKTLEKNRLHITNVDGSVKVQNASVTIPNVLATNGVVHIIDGVLMPPAKNIVQLAVATPTLSTLVTALTDGNLVTALSGIGPFTVFAPTNDAFKALPAATLASLLKPANIKKLDSLLEYHVIAGSALYSEDLTASQDVKTLQGQMLHITDVDGSVTVQNAKVIQADIQAKNGVVHVIDGVLSPPAAPDAPDDSSSSSHTVIIVVGIIAAVILVGGGAFFWYKKSKKMEAAQQEDKEPLHQPHDDHDVEDPIARRN